MKKLLFGNLSTKFMALFLAALTWMYLFTQDTDQNNLDILFMPRIDTRDFASVSFATSEEKPRPLTPGQLFNVRVTGPKGDVKALRPRTFKCEPLIDPQNLTELHGSKDLVLQRRDFDLPDKFGVDPLPSATVTLRYVKFVTRLVKLTATPDDYLGAPAPDHKVVSITPVPSEIEARVPADREGLKEVRIKPVPLDGNRGDVTVTGEIDEPDIQLKRAFEVRVQIIPVPKKARLTLDLTLLAKPENQSRIERGEKSVEIEIQGPEELVREAEKRPAVFQPYVVVTDTDMEPPGPKAIAHLGCHILDPKYQGRITVLLKPDTKPENRPVKVTVQAKKP